MNAEKVRILLEEVNKELSNTSGVEDNVVTQQLLNSIEELQAQLPEKKSGPNLEQIKNDTEKLTRDFLNSIWDMIEKGA